MKATAIAFLFTLVIAPASFSQPPADLQHQLDEAERRIVRLRPAVFSQLPRNVVRELERRGFTIPQTPFTKGPHNVIRGELLKPGQMDWAVLCCGFGQSQKP